MESDRGKAIEVSHLYFAYGSCKILHDVALTIEKGSIVGLLGPNGSGKSTIMKIICGLLDDHSDSVRVFGKRLSAFSRKEIARFLSLVPQESFFSFPFSVLEVVIMGRYPHIDTFSFESQQDIAIAYEALDRCDASNLASRKIHELSSGERQRVVFARALAQQPQILLLDEPASFLDIKYQVDLYDNVRELAREKDCTILTVLHDFNLAAEYCDRIYLLSDGEIKAGGAVTEVLTYRNLKNVFNTEIYVDINDLTGKPLIIPLSKDVHTGFDRE
ncbi:MAG TPA: ABC transporter ATP-binding protein [Gammaproteobacteria bacterium]